MGKLNTNGNAYTIIYASVMVIIVAFLLAFVASALKPTQDDNVANDKRSQILAALRIEKGSDYNVQEKYAELVKADPVYTKTTEKKSEQGGFDVSKTQLSNAKLLLKKAEDLTPDEKEKLESLERPLYVAETPEGTKYVIPMTGAGLWGGIWGYVALDDDCETVYGTYFSHESETAGLGARITESDFQSKFQGKKLYAGDDKSKVALSVVKKGKEGDLSADNYVNGITGATLTSDGVNNMIQQSLSAYSDILESLKK